MCQDLIHYYKSIWRKYDMAKTTTSPSELVETHKPKNFKFKYYFKDDELLKELEKEGYDILSTDTIKNDPLTNYAYNNTEFVYHERTIIGKAKEPTELEDGIMISKKMITKADKKLLRIGIGYFTFNDLSYMAIRLEYERFDILELFVTI